MEANVDIESVSLLSSEPVRFTFSLAPQAQVGRIKHRSADELHISLVHYEWLFLSTIMSLQTIEKNTTFMYSVSRKCNWDMYIHIFVWDVVTFPIHLSLLFATVGQQPKSALFRQMARQHEPVKGTFAVPPSFYPRLEEVERKERVIFGSKYMFLAMIEKLRKHRSGMCPRLAISEVSMTLKHFLVRTKQSTVWDFRKLPKLRIANMHF